MEILDFMVGFNSSKIPPKLSLFVLFSVFLSSSSLIIHIVDFILRFGFTFAALFVLLAFKLAELMKSIKIITDKVFWMTDK